MDALYLAFAAILFALILGLAAGCERLQHPRSTS